MNNTVLETLNKMWYKQGLFYPGPQPVSIERKYLNIIKNNKNDYWVAPKTDGVRQAMGILELDGEYNVYLYDRRLNSKKLKNVKLKKNILKGTLVDGELINDNVYIIFDCLLICGKDVSKYSFSERMQFVKTLLSGVKIENIQLKLKEFTIFSKFKTFIENYVKEYDQDGYIFMPEKGIVSIGTHNSLYKWKNNLDNTVDFLVTPKGILYLINSNELCKTRNKLTFIPDYIKNSTNNTIVECKCNDINSKTWIPIFPRHDKKDPNSQYVFKKTIINIKENISLEEFY